MLQGLAVKQVALLKALAGEFRAPLKKLSTLDLIELDDGRRWAIVDPLFELWLQAHQV